MNNVIYTVGTLIGTLFLSYMLISPGKKDFGKVRYHLKSRYKAGLVAIFLFFVAGSLAAMVLGTEEISPERLMEVAFWISLMFMMIYLQADDLLITDQGVAFSDFFGRVRGRYYPWKTVMEAQITDKRVSFVVELEGKPKKVGLSIKSLDEATRTEMEKMVRKAMGSYTKVKGR